MRTIAFAALAAALLAAPAARAQSEADFVAAFSGRWQTLDPAFSSGGACSIALDGAAAGDAYRLTASQCGGALAAVARWDIVDSQLGLVDESGAVLARLGGNQQRMSGETAKGATVIFERVQDAADAAPVSPATNAECLYLGYTATCASPDQRTVPQLDAARRSAEVSVLVRLNARAEARPDADVLATIPPGTCVVVDQCTAASDGNWCRAQVSNFSGWIRQQAVRENRWAVLTYTPKCSG